MKPNRYQCLAFDAVGTIIHPTPSAAEVYYCLARRYGSQLSAEEIAGRFRTAFRVSEQGDVTAEPGQGHTTSEAREELRWRQIVASVIDDIADTDRCFSDLFAHFARPASWSCFDDVPETISRFQAAGYRLAIASNFDSRLHAVCNGMASLRAIELRIISSEVGCRKPGRLFFAALVARAGCHAGDVLMIGDDRANDVEGARAAGLEAILIKRRGHCGPGEISSLIELCDLLDVA